LTRTDKRLTPQGYVSAIDIVNLGYRHRLGARLTLVATLSDAFYGQRFRQVEVTPTFTQDYSRFVYGRVAFAGIVASFGASAKDRPASFDYEE